MFRHERETAQRVPAGTAVFREGDAGHVMYVILEGEVAIAVQGVEVDHAGPGDAFGEMALIDDAPRSATVTTITDCLLVEIGERRFEFLVQQHPRFALQMMRVLADRLRRRPVSGPATTSGSSS